jgi:hypothetical protein
MALGSLRTEKTEPPKQGSNEPLDRVLGMVLAYLEFLKGAGHKHLNFGSKP